MAWIVLVAAITANAVNLAAQPAPSLPPEGFAAFPALWNQPQPEPPDSTSAPAPKPSGDTDRITSFPDTVQAPPLNMLAERIVAAPGDADTSADQCVRLEGYYSQSGGMQTERVESVLHPDTSADIATRKPPVITHRSFTSVRIGDLDFRAAPTIRQHVRPGELAFPIGLVLPHDERELFNAVYAVYANDAPPLFAAPGIEPMDVMDAITGAARWQTPNLQTRQAMLRLLSRMPGVGVHEDAQDPLLRLTIAVTLTAAGGDTTAYFSPATGQLLAVTEITRAGYTPPGTTLPHLRQAVVYWPGCASTTTLRRPGGKTTGPAHWRTALGIGRTPSALVSGSTRQETRP